MEVSEAPSPPPGVLVTGHFREGFGYRVRRPNGSGNWLLTYTLNGRGLYRGSGPDLLVGSGDVVLLGPDVPHDYSVPEGGFWEFLWAHFQPRLEWFEWWNPLLAGEGPWLSHLETFGARERARRTFLRLRADAQPRATCLASWRSTGWRRCCCSRYRKGRVGVQSTRGCGRSWISSPQTSPPIMMCLASRGRSRSRHRGYLTSSRRRSANR